MKTLLVNPTPAAFDAISKSLAGSTIELLQSEGRDPVSDEIKNTGARIILVNWSADDSSMAPLCESIRGIKGAYIYILVILPREKEKFLTEIMDTGADDFVFRPFSGVEFELRIRNATRLIAMQDSIVSSRKKLMLHAKEDPQTGLLNRRALMDEVLNEMGRVSREMTLLSSIMVHFSNYKDIIDTYGRETGEYVLSEFSMRLKKSCRPYDKIGRYTVSDFLVFLPGSGAENSLRVSERIMSSLTGTEIVYQKLKIPVEVSLGVSEIYPDDVADNKTVNDHLMNDLLLDALIKRAETAAEKAVAHGINTIEVCES